MTAKHVVAVTWSRLVAPIVGLGLIAGMGAISGWPSWWVSLMATSAIVVVAVVAFGWRSSPTVRIAVCLAVAIASLGTVAVAAVDLQRERAIGDDRADSGRVAGDLVCRILGDGTQAGRAAARAASTGELAQRLASGAAVSTSSPPTAATRCTPVRVGVGDVDAGAAQVVVAVDLIGADPVASGRVVAARLERVDGSWRVATLDVVR